jgi:hypothetical protein
MEFSKGEEDLSRKMEMYYKDIGKKEIWMEEDFFMITNLEKFHQAYGKMGSFKVKIF